MLRQELAERRWQALFAALKEVFERQALKSTVVLKGNILTRFLALITAYSIFTNLSAAMGSEVVAANGLLLQIVFLSQFTVNGIGLTTQTLTGNFKAKGQIKQMMPLLSVSILSSLIISSILASVCIFFPQIVFGLLTSHQRVSKSISHYISWLFPLLSCNAIAFMLEGYTIGLKEGAKLRNSALIALGLGFIPLAVVAWYFLSNHLLWLSLTFYMATLIFSLGIQLPGMQLNSKQSLQWRAVSVDSSQD